MSTTSAPDSDQFSLVITPPTPLHEQHQLEKFFSGVANLDQWLIRRARKNQVSGASRTFVACHEQRVMMYYALASSAIAVQSAPGHFRRNMPDPIPVVVLARLAIDRQCQGHGFGRALIRDAAQRVMQAADSIGIRGLITHAISPDARAFYLKMGFEPSPLDDMLLMISLADLQHAI
jgi:GNAT superfamily N-acetyltransferase